MSRPAAVLALAALLLITHAASADEVRWRTDYNSARREAMQTGRPLLLDFGNAGCIWCKRLDATTFRAPAVVERLNSRFIPVKVDGDRSVQLVQALGIESYPTLIVAAPNGLVLGRQNGYLEAAAMAQLLDQSLAKMPRPQPALTPVEARVPVPSAPAPTPEAPSVDPAREEINRKLSQVYLDRGLDLCRRGRHADGEQYFTLASTLSPHTPEAATARDLLQRLRAGQDPTRP